MQKSDFWKSSKLAVAIAGSKLGVYEGATFLEQDTPMAAKNSKLEFWRFGISCWGFRLPNP